MFYDDPVRGLVCTCGVICTRWVATYPDSPIRSSGSAVKELATALPISFMAKSDHMLPAVALQPCPLISLDVPHECLELQLHT